MNTTLEQLKSDVDALRARADVTDSRAMETTRLLTGLRSDIADVRTDVRRDIGQLSDQMRHAYYLIGATPDDIVRIDTNVAHIRRNLVNVRHDLAGVKKNVARLQADVTGLKRDVAGLKSDMAEVKSDVAGLKSDMAEVKSDVAGLKSDVAGLKSDMGRLDVNIVAIMRHLGMLRAAEPPVS